MSRPRGTEEQRQAAEAKRKVKLLAEVKSLVPTKGKSWGEYYDRTGQGDAMDGAEFRGSGSLGQGARQAPIRRTE